jgi:hypothetical protein
MCCSIGKLRGITDISDRASEDCCPRISLLCEAKAAAQYLFKRLREKGEYLRRPDFTAVDAEFMSILIGLAKDGEDLKVVRLA